MSQVILCWGVIESKCARIRYCELSSRRNSRSPIVMKMIYYTFIIMHNFAWVNQRFDSVKINLRYRQLLVMYYRPIKPFKNSFENKRVNTRCIQNTIKLISLSSIDSVLIPPFYHELNWTWCSKVRSIASPIKFIFQQFSL